MTNKSPEEWIEVFTQWTNELMGLRECDGIDPALLQLGINVNARCVYLWQLYAEFGIPFPQDDIDLIEDFINKLRGDNGNAA